MPDRRKQRVEPRCSALRRSAATGICLFSARWHVGSSSRLSSFSSRFSCCITGNYAQISAFEHSFRDFIFRCREINTRTNRRVKMTYFWLSILQLAKSLICFFNKLLKKLTSCAGNDYRDLAKSSTKNSLFSYFMQIRTLMLFINHFL